MQSLPDSTLFSKRNIIKRYNRIFNSSVTDCDDITVSAGATVSKDLNVGGAMTVGGALTVTGNAYFNVNVDINGDLTYDEVNARNLNISYSTVGFAQLKHDCCA